MRVVRAVMLALLIVGAVAGAAYAFAVNEYPPPPDGVVSLPYNFVFKPKDGAPPFAFYFKAGDLPPGLKIELDGTFHGTPTQPGTFNFDVEATQYDGSASQRSFAVTIRDKLTITTAALKSAGVGAPYTATLGVTGNGGLGMGWSVSAGALPAGLTLAPDGTPGDSTISGTPTAVGTSTFTVKVGDTDGFVPSRATTKQFTIAVVAPLGVQAPAAPLPTGIVGKPYKGLPASATGGATPYRWAIAGGTAPPGLTVDPATGALQGTPAAAGTFAFTVGVTDAAGRTATSPATVTVVQALDLVTTHVHDARVGHPYRAKLLARGGLLPRTWTVKRGELPLGLRLNEATGVLRGTARTPGTFHFTILVMDALRQRSSAPIVLNVRA